MKKEVLLIVLLFSLSTFGHANTKDEFTKIKKKWSEILISSPSDFEQDEQSKIEMERSIKQLENSVSKVLEKLNKEEEKQYLFEDLKDLKNGANVLSSFENIKTLAKAYATPNTQYYKSEDLQKIIENSLNKLNKEAYHEGISETGNWWQWEIGIPKSINEIGLIMDKDLSADLVGNLVNASKYFQPYATHSGASPAAKYSTSPNKRISKGGNRMDTAIISFGRGLLVEDEVETMNGINAIADIGEIVKEDDGFYEDGSFIQHSNVAYNGTYAAVMFNGLGTVLYATEGTKFKPEDSKLNNLYNFIINDYKYLMINGGVNDSVSGRAISRDNTSDLDRGRALIASFAMISEGVGSPYKEKIQELVKKSILENNYYNVIDKTGNSVIKNILRKIVKNNTINTKTASGTKIFYAMDRAIQMNNKGGKVAVSMHSNRIANYETMNGENLKGWHTGDGMTYIYGIDSAAFTDYWQTVDKLHLPGTTESTNERRASSGERRVSVTMPPKSWVGGATDGNVAMIGMDFVSWNNKTNAKKSWFMLGEEVIALGSGISSNDGDIHTTVDNRIIHNIKDIKVTINGESVLERKKVGVRAGDYINFTNEKLNENIGYKMILNSIMSVNLGEERGSWKEIGGTSEEMNTKKYFEMYLDHGKNPKDSKYAYVILPMFSEKEVKDYDINSIDIIEQNDEAHIIEDKNRKIIGVNLWRNKEKKVKDIKLFSPVSLIKKEKNDGMTLVISDPTQLSRYETIIEVDGEYELLTPNNSVKLEIKKGKTRIKVNLVNNGKSVVINLKK